MKYNRLLTTLGATVLGLLAIFSINSINFGFDFYPLSVNVVVTVIYIFCIAMLAGQCTEKLKPARMRYRERVLWLTGGSIVAALVNLGFFIITRYIAQIQSSYPSLAMTNTASGLILVVAFGSSALFLKYMKLPNFLWVAAFGILEGFYLQTIALSWANGLAFLLFELCGFIVGFVIGDGIFNAWNVRLRYKLLVAGCIPVLTTLAANLLLR